MNLRYFLATLCLFISTIGQAAERLITLGGAVTEIVYALDKQDEIIATDITSYYPQATHAIPKVGYLRTLSAEGLLSMRPTLIIADASAGPTNVLKQLRDAGVNIIQLQEGYTPEHVTTNIRLIGKALQAAKTDSVANQYETHWQQVKAQLATLKGSPKVLFVLDHTGKSAQAAGDHTAASAVIQLINAKNVMGGQFSGYRPLTAESVVAAAPEVIIATSEGVQASGGISKFLDKPGLKMTPAGQSQRVISIDSLLLLGFTPRLPTLLADLAQTVRKPAATR